MIINKDFYFCNKCHEAYSFESSKSYSKNCPICGGLMEFYANNDCDTERVKKPPYEATKDPKSPYYKSTVECPYCHSQDTTKISGLSKAGNVALFGIFAMGKVGKQWKCNDCKSDF